MSAGKSQSWFSRFSKRASHWAGSPAAFASAVALIVLWGATGPIFHFSDTWQLVINTSTTIITFLMVFLIQNTQNRDSAATQLKLDELIRSIEGAHTALLDLEELEQADLDRIREDYGELAARARKALRQGKHDTGTPVVRRAGDRGNGSPRARGVRARRGAGTRSE